MNRDSINPCSALTNIHVVNNNKHQISTKSLTFQMSTFHPAFTRQNVYLTYWPLWDMVIIIKCHEFMITSCEIVVMWMPQKTFHNKSTLVQVMARCPQAKTINRADVSTYPCRHMESLDHNKLINKTPTDFAQFRRPLWKMMSGCRHWWPSAKTLE